MPLRTTGSQISTLKPESLYFGQNCEQKSFCECNDKQINDGQQHRLWHPGFMTLQYVNWVLLVLART